MRYSTIRERMGVVLVARSFVGNVEEAFYEKAPYTHEQILRIKKKTVYTLSKTSETPYLDWSNEFTKYKNMLHEMSKEEIKNKWPDVWENVIVPFSLGE